MSLNGTVELVEIIEKRKNMARQRKQNIWIVVSVLSGIPVEVEGYRDRRAAEKREKMLRKGMRPDYDEIGLFEISI